LPSSSNAEQPDDQPDSGVSYTYLPVVSGPCESM